MEWCRANSAVIILECLDLELGLNNLEWEYLATINVASVSEVEGTKDLVIQASMQEMLIILDSSLNLVISTKFFLRSNQKDREASLLMRLAILPTTSP